MIKPKVSDTAYDFTFFTDICGAFDKVKFTLSFLSFQTSTKVTFMKVIWLTVTFFGNFEAEIYLSNV